MIDTLNVEIFFKIYVQKLLFLYTCYVKYVLYFW